MKIEETGLEGKEVTVHDFDHAADDLGFVRWAWDYKRATYDFKYEDKKQGEIYYLRVPATSIKGEIEEEGSDSVLKIGTPYIGRHTYPHGLDYEYNFPKKILDDAKKRLENLSSHF
ncbi:YugN family protein [Caldalkalibacillus salinus]|uniref:YugN family protein n=1 Tax=Caldalkalibacillus salinus TaxID=2803787 RepID=UPI00192373BB